MKNTKNVQSEDKTNANNITILSRVTESVRGSNVELKPSTKFNYIHII